MVTGTTLRWRSAARATAGSGALTAEPTIRYRPRAGVTLEAEAEALANVYAFILEAYERHKAAETVKSSEDAEGGGGREHELNDANDQ